MRVGPNCKRVRGRNEWTNDAGYAMGYSGRYKERPGATLVRFHRKTKVQKGGESDNVVGGKRCGCVHAGQAKIDRIRIREGRNASRGFAAATTASIRGRGRVRLCLLGLRGGRAAAV
jgi:hypothetical protein